MLAYSIPASAAAVAASVGAISRLAGLAGSARITASASRYWGAIVGPMVSLHPAGVLASSLTVALVLMVARLASVRASGSVPRPASSVVKTGGAGRPGSGWVLEASAIFLTEAIR